MRDSIHVRDRIQNNINVSPDGCWTWALALTRDGYAQMKIDGVQKYAHRVSYELNIAPIPDGLQIDHLCRNRACVNPAHLEPVTLQENLRRSQLVLSTANAAKSHCPAGHEYDLGNTYSDRRGRRSCRACQRERMRRTRLAKKLSLAR